jgi:hypothetical protein
MNLEQLGRWVIMMSKIREGDVPIPISNMVMTPNEYLQVTMMDASMLNRLEARQLASMDELKDIIKERLRIRYAEGRLHTLHTMDLSGEVIITPEMRLAEVENESEMGWRFIKADYKFMQEMISRL